MKNYYVFLKSDLNDRTIDVLIDHAVRFSLVNSVEELPEGENIDDIDKVLELYLST